MSFSDKLIFFRTRYGLSKNELGERMGLSTKIINDWEKGKTLPNDRDYDKLSEIFGIKKDFFIDDTLSYKNLENFSRDEYWGVGLDRVDCDGYIEMSKKYSRFLSMGIYFILLIPIVIILIGKILPLIFESLVGKDLTIYQVIISLILLVRGLIFIRMSKKRKDKYNFVDNGMMYYLKKDDRIYVENIIDQEKPKSRQRIIFGAIFIVLALIISFNFDKIFGSVGETLRGIIVIVVLVLINEGINSILNYSFRLSTINKLLDKQNSYNFEDKNL